MALALHDRLARGGGLDQRKVKAVDVHLEDDDVVLLQPSLVTMSSRPHMKNSLPWNHSIWTLLAKLALVEGHADRCLRCHL
jgi:hypothetical protein